VTGRTWAYAATLVSLLLQSAAPQSFEEVVRQAAVARQSNRQDEALALYREGLRLRPSWADGWWNLGSILYDKALYGEAGDAFRKLTVIDPKAVPGYVFLGISEYKMKQYDAAFRDLDSARMLGLPNGHPVTAAARYYLALLLNRNGLHDAAADLLLSMSATAEKSPEVLESFGISGLRIRKLPEELPDEIQQLSRAVGQAMAAAGQRHVPESLKLLEGLLQAHPAQPNLHYLYGTVLLQAGSGQAVEEFQDELKLQPDCLPAMLAVAREKERTGQLEDARAYAEKAVHAEQGNFETHAILGKILVAQEHVKEGLSELERALALEPGSPQVYFTLASVYAKLGREEDARKARAQFLRLRKLADEQR
jgi:tetratricopeptide (TPR) repeat protein